MKTFIFNTQDKEKFSVKTESLRTAFLYLQ